ncbi:MAG: response regulator transcription factor [Lachnospiraceae bacterium]
MTKTRVLIIDDQLMARQLFELYLSSGENYEVVGTLASAAFAETFIRNTPVDLIIMDILMNDGSNGLDAAEKIKQLRPDIKIVAVTSMVEASWMKRAEKIGIESFWYKEAAQETILDVLDRTVAGESVYPDTPPSVPLGLAESEDFTERELEVLRLMTTGMSNTQIAGKLDITQNTVKTHIQHMLDKTGFDNRTELAIEARVKGIVVNIDKE